MAVANFDVNSIMEKQRAYFSSGKTLSVDFRLEQLKKLRKIIVENEVAILDALHLSLIHI